MTSSGVYRGRDGARNEVIGVPWRRRTPPATVTHTSALGRYRRAVDRYHDCLQSMPERALRRELTELGGPLDAVLEDFEDALAQRRPGKAREDAVLAAVQRAATLCAHATEAALMANEAAWRYDADEVGRYLDTVRLLVKKIDELGDEVRPGP